MIKNVVLNKYLKLLIACVFVMLVAVQANKSFVLDEIDFPVVSHATSQTLKPIYYRGEVSPQHVGTYHPTLYINSLAVFIKAFGYSEISVRFFGMVCTLAAAYLLVLIFRQLAKKNDTTEILFLGLFLLNPYTIANTTLPDIDSTVLPVVILLFIYFSLKYLLEKKNMGNKTMFILAFLFGLALWSKLTTPLIIPPYLVGLAIITSKDYKKSIIFATKVTLIGIAGFVFTYFIYCKLLGLSTTYTYRFLLDSFTKGTSNDGPVVGALNNLRNIQNFVYWPTLPVVGLLGISFFGVMLDKEKSEKTKIKKLLMVTALVTTMFYIALISPFGGFFKYPFPVFGILLLAVAFFYDACFGRIKLKALYTLAATMFGFLLELVFWRDSMFINSQSFMSLVVLLFVVVGCFVLLWMYARRNLVTSIFVLFLCFCVGFQLSISRIQAKAPYPTKYHYGQIGLDQTAEYLRSNTSPDEIIWSMKDVGYYVNNRYYESYGYYFDKSLEAELIHMLEDGKVRYYVVTTGIGQDNIDAYPNIKQILGTSAVREKQFGNFIIYKAKE